MGRRESRIFKLNDEIARYQAELRQAQAELDNHRSLADDAARDAAVFDTPVTISLLVEKLGDKFKFFPDKKTPMDVLPCPVAYGLKKGDTAWEGAVSDFIRRKKDSGELQALFDQYMTAKFITEE